MIAGLSGAFATMVALREVEVNNGAGQVVDLSLLEPIIGIMGPDAAIYQHTGEKPQRLGNRAENAAPRNAYKCLDGQWLVMSGSTQRMAERIRKAIGCGHLVDDPRFSTNASRIKNVEILDEFIGDFVGLLTQRQNLEHFELHQVTVGPILSVDAIMQNEHVRQRQVLTEVPDGELGSVLIHYVFPRLSRTPGLIRSASPRLGEHQELVGGELP
jgi:crotonobetainyl-CoA:carnitine CoA-transferase CaiB-like acyl-CoA transferase